MTNDDKGRFEDLLFNSESLTKEEHDLREELAAWCQEKLYMGARPVPLHVALRIMANWMESPKDYGFEVDKREIDERKRRERVAEFRAAFRVVTDADE